MPADIRDIPAYSSTDDLRIVARIPWTVVPSMWTVVEGAPTGQNDILAGNTALGSYIVLYPLRRNGRILRGLNTNRVYYTYTDISALDCFRHFE